MKESKKIAFLTHRDLLDLDCDDRLLAAELSRRGWSVNPVAWDEPGEDLTRYALTLVRSPWNYYRHYGDFLAWLERAETCTRLENPAKVLRWSLDKRYLFDLAARGIAIVPTRLLERGSMPDLEGLLRASGPHGAVLKPVVSADSFATIRVPPGEIETARRHLERWLPDRDFLLQPYLPEVEDPGERCLVFLGGKYSHAVSKNALTRGGRWAGLPEGVRVAADAEEIDLGRRALEVARSILRLDRPLLYARVDLLPGRDREPLLLELELAEPSLFFGTAAGSASLLADQLEERLRSLGAEDGPPVSRSAS